MSDTRCCSGWNAWSLDDDFYMMRGCVLCHSPRGTDMPTQATDADSVCTTQSTHVTLSTLCATTQSAARDEFALLQTHMRTRDKVGMLLNKESGPDGQSPEPVRADSPARSFASLPPSPSRDSKAVSLPSNVSCCYKRKR